MANSEAGARTGGASRQRDKRQKEKSGREGKGARKEKQENKERRTSGASHPATQQAMEKEVKKGIQK